MICNAYQVVSLTAAEETKIGHMMRDLARREGQHARAPHITPTFSGVKMGRPENPNRAKALAVLANGPMRAQDIGKALGITTGRATDALTSAKRLGLVECEGWVWRLA